MSFNQQWVCLCSLYFPITRHGLYSTENILLLSFATAMQCRTEYTWSKTCGKCIMSWKGSLVEEMFYVFSEASRMAVLFPGTHSFTGVLMVLCKSDLHLELRLRISGAITSSLSHAFMVGTRKTSHQQMLNFDKCLNFLFIFYYNQQMHNYIIKVLYCTCQTSKTVTVTKELYMQLKTHTDYVRVL
jgi:hypothetical protein